MRPQYKNTRGNAEGYGKGKRAGVHSTPAIFLFFFPLTNVLTSTTPPPLTEDEKRAIKGAFFVFSGSYDLPHPPDPPPFPTRQTPKMHQGGAF